jgi:hypothetical protein
MALPENPQPILQPIEQLSDRLLLELASSQMPPEQRARLADLSARQKAGGLTDDEPQELGTLLQHYNEGWLRRTDALIEAIRRGLMEPM